MFVKCLLGLALVAIVIEHIRPAALPIGKA